MTFEKNIFCILFLIGLVAGCNSSATGVAQNGQDHVANGGTSSGSETPTSPTLTTDEQTEQQMEIADRVPEIMSSPSGDEQIVGLASGHPAPFSGVLLNPGAAAWLEAEPDATQERCQLFVTRRLGEVRAEFRADILRLRLHIETLSAFHQIELNNRDAQISSLLRTNEELRNAGVQWWEQVLWIGGALVVGAGLGIILGLVAN